MLEFYHFRKDYLRNTEISYHVFWDILTVCRNPRVSQNHDFRTSDSGNKIGVGSPASNPANVEHLGAH